MKLTVLAGSSLGGAGSCVREEVHQLDGTPACVCACYAASEMAGPCKQTLSSDFQLISVAPCWCSQLLSMIFVFHPPTMHCCFLRCLQEFISSLE